MVMYWFSHLMRIGAAERFVYGFIVNASVVDSGSLFNFEVAVFCPAQAGNVVTQQMAVQPVFRFFFRKSHKTFGLSAHDVIGAYSVKRAVMRQLFSPQN